MVVDCVGLLWRMGGVGVPGPTGGILAFRRGAWTGICCAWHNLETCGSVLLCYADIPSIVM